MSGGKQEVIIRIIKDLRNDSCYGCYICNDDCKKLQNDAADLLEYLQKGREEEE